MSEKLVTIDGNQAATSVAYRLSEVVAIYPITPASPMGELADQWASEERPNIWGSIPDVSELQSEGGASGAIHGAVQAGALSTTFTASQGLLLMIPNLFKMAGELSPAVIHVSARTVATHALSIFGDHSDVMAARQTGWALLASSSVQEAHDLALVAHSATLDSRVPFIHFFDGFRTSHELNKISELPDEVLAKMIDEAKISEHRARALSPDHPVLRGTAQNPDVFFQARESCNKFYDATPAIVQAAMDRLFELCGRRYNLFDYVGHPEAERVVVLMGSGADTARETARILAEQGEKVGTLTVRLYRPFAVEAFLKTLPETVKSIAVLDRTKEPGAPAEPLALDVALALREGSGAKKDARLIAGRFGLSSKEFTPAMVKAVFDELAKDAPKKTFTVGIADDVTGLSLDWDRDWELPDDGTIGALFYGLGSDGTVSANKSAIKIIGEATEMNAQGHFVYDSKKAGAMTVSHLRFGKNPIRAPYELESAHYVACHQPQFIDRFDILARARKDGTFVLNTPVPAAEVFASLPRLYQERIREKGLKVYAIDAASVAKAAGMGTRINTVMQTVFFALSKVLPRDEAIQHIKDSIEKTYGIKGKALVDKNFAAVDATLASLTEVNVTDDAATGPEMAALVPEKVDDFVKRVTAKIIAGHGNDLPVSAFPVDGTFPTGTAAVERRNIASEIPIWDEVTCIQCNKCAIVCPHAAIRVKAFAEGDRPKSDGFLAVPYKAKDFPAGSLYTVQVAPEDCTGCAMCVEACPAKNKTAVKLKAINMVKKEEVLEVEKQRWEAFLTIPEADRKELKLETVKGSQFAQPLFEFSGACVGCGETPYVKLVSQLFGDRMLVANATGCSSIYGGNLPTTPWSQNASGAGPTWSNSLFEDNAEFGIGFRYAVDALEKKARTLLDRLSGKLDAELVGSLKDFHPTDEAGYQRRREEIAKLRGALAELGGSEAKALADVCEHLLPRSVWIMGGDGWAYDIGYGGLDHVLASGKNVNILVLDTEVYSNTGGQMSKATPKGAVAKFAAAGKGTEKKDMALLAMGYGNVYVARIAMGSSDTQTVKALTEAESYPGVSLVLAYSHCIAHGIDMTLGMNQQDLAVKTGHWPLLRYDPRRSEQGKPPLQLDSKAPSLPYREYAEREGRFRVLIHSRPERANRLLEEAEREARDRYALYYQLAHPETGASR
ncbi:MAG: pyruvate:ferredoxin (flavodoxin) oxidoreductase [Deltaproteobacteria bacterium]|nr:pyruvate:ferredoxin (flavodoxin) oxidoreductase [Deltaproteobacteria bacterium]